MYLNLRSYLIFLALFALCASGCATKKTQSVSNYKPTNSRSSTFNFNQLVNAKELFYVFSKEPSGKPSSIITITSDQEKALAYFKHPSAITTKDCIKIAITNEASLCQEKMWYAREDKTNLVTRKNRNGNEVAAGTIIATVNAPIALAADILTFSPSLKHSRESLTHTFTKSVQNVDELNSAKNEVLYLLEQQFKLKQNSEEARKYGGLSSYTQTESWTPVKDWQELFQLINGNTLISLAKFFCSDKSSPDPCIGVAILESSSLKKGRNKATVIHPNANKLFNSVWGFYQINMSRTGLDIGLVIIPAKEEGISSTDIPFEEMISVNKDKNIIRYNYSNAPMADHVFDVNNLDKDMQYISIIKGHKTHFIQEAKNGNYKNIDATGQMSLDQLITGKIIQGVATLLVDALETMKTKEWQEKHKEKLNQERLDTNRQDAACKKNSRDCYELVERKEKHATIKCLVGLDAGKTKDLYLNHKGEWEWSRFLMTTADTDLEMLAKSICS